MGERVKEITMTKNKTGEDVVSLTPIKRATLCFFAILFFLSVTAFAVPPVIYEVTITDGETLTTVSTVRTEPEKILEDNGIVLTEDRGDKIVKSFFDSENSTAFVEYKRGVKITVKNYDGSKKSVYCSGTVGDAVNKAQIDIPEGHETSVSLQENAKEDMVVEIYNTYKVKIKCNGKVKKRTVSGGNVGEALKNAGYELGEFDYTSPKSSAELKDGMTITIHKVTVKERTKTVKLDYKTAYKETDSLYINQSRVVTKGKKGKKEILYNDFYVDGKLSKSVKVSETKKTKPVNEVVEIGKKVYPYPSTLPTGTPMSELRVPSYVKIGSNGLPQNYKKAINAKATAYCEPGGTTSTGRPAMAGYIAVDPAEIPYGTEMYIVSADGRYVYGYCIAADTGGFIYSVDNTVDLYMNSESQCVNWGRRDIIIYFL